MKVVFEFFEMNKNIKFCPGYLLHRKKKPNKKTVAITTIPSFLYKNENQIDNVKVLLFYFMYSSIWWLFL